MNSLRSKWLGDLPRITQVEKIRLEFAPSFVNFQLISDASPFIMSDPTSKQGTGNVTNWLSFEHKESRHSATSSQPLFPVVV